MKATTATIRRLTAPKSCWSNYLYRTYIDGKPLHEPYLGGQPSSLGLDDRAWNVGDGAVFVMGDNRVHSTDSRDYGEIGLDSVLGRVVSRLWPPTRWGGLGSGVG